MARTLHFDCSCACGEVRASMTTEASVTTRCVCFCRDCRAFAHALDRASDTLDGQGGTEVIQMVPGALRIEKGHHQLALMRLAENGIFRWHTTCCRSPIGNTLRTTRFPFIGIIDSFLTEDARSELQHRLPLHGHVYTQFAQDAPPGEARRDRGDDQPQGGTALVMRRFAKIVLRSWLNADARRSPFFDENGQPVCKPVVLAKDERSRIAALG